MSTSPPKLTSSPTPLGGDPTLIPIETLYTNARELTTLFPRLAALVTVPGSNTIDPDTPKQTKFVYEPPWNTPAANLKFSIHEEARRFENALNLKLFGTARFRGPSDHNTLAAIGRLPVLIDHARAKKIDNHDVTDTEHLLTSWPRLIRLQLDEALPGEQPWTKAPGNLRCPHCDIRLELEPGWQHHPEQADVICRRCKDEFGQTLRWAPTTWLSILQDDAG